MLKRIYLEISNICNVQCTFCPVVGRGQKVMGLEEFEGILTQAVPLAQEVCLHLMGEPLAHPKFASILALCEKHSARIQITTNGLLLKKHDAALLGSPCIRQINFSLQAFKDNFPEKKLEEYLVPILDFANRADAIRPDLYINLRLWNQNSPACDDADIFGCVERYFGVRINRAIDVGAVKSKRIKNRLYFHFDSRFEWPSLDSDFQGTAGRCNGILQHIGIHADGVVVPCCLDKEAVIPLGNCHEQPLEAILQSPRAGAMREGFLKGVLVEELCRHCSYINRFKK